VRLIFGTLTLVLVAVAPAAAVDKKAKDSPVVAATRKKLKSNKVTVDYQDTRLEEVLADLKKQTEDISIRVDPKAGVNQNTKVTYKADDAPLDEVLDKMFKKYDLGYVIGTKKDGRYEGWLIINKSNARGVAEKEKPAASDDASEDEPAGKKGKPKPKATKKPPTEDQPEQPPEDPEVRATAKLKLAKQLDENGRKEAAKERYQEILKKWPKTKAAKEAKELLEKLDQ
jgi:hypothetical protein